MLDFEDAARRLLVRGLVVHLQGSAVRKVQLLCVACQKDQVSGITVDSKGQWFRRLQSLILISLCGRK